MTTHHSQTVIVTCSFCQRLNTEVTTLVAGPGVFICDGCVALASGIIEGKQVLTPRIAPWERDTNLDEVLSNLAPVSAAGLQAEQNLTAWVTKARTLGATWTQIGQALGMARQSAWERFSGEK